MVYTVLVDAFDLVEFQSFKYRSEVIYRSITVLESFSSLLTWLVLNTCTQWTQSPNHVLHEVLAHAPVHQICTLVHNEPKVPPCTVLHEDPNPECYGSNRAAACGSRIWIVLFPCSLYTCTQWTLVPTVSSMMVLIVLLPCSLNTCFVFNEPGSLPFPPWWSW